MAATRASIPSARHKGLLWIGLGAGTIAALAVIIVLLWPGSADSGAINAGQADDFAISSVTTNAEGGFHLVRLGVDEFVALSWREPGSSCTVPWRPNFDWNGSLGWFRDPCTGSTFDRAGRLVFGPSPRGLDRYPVTVSEEDVIVDTSRYVCGYAPPGAPCVDTLP
jgi:Rieske Fe-S protein